MNESLIIIGILVILFGFAMIIIGSITAKSKGKAEGGFALWIGPIPIIGATSKEMFYTVLLVSILFLIVFLVLNKSIFT